jgi:hypothetical protein
VRSGALRGRPSFGGHQITPHATAREDARQGAVEDVPLLITAPGRIDLEDLATVGEGLEPMPNLTAAPKLRTHAGAEIVDVLLERHGSEGPEHGRLPFRLTHYDSS